MSRTSARANAPESRKPANKPPAHRKGPIHVRGDKPSLSEAERARLKRWANDRLDAFMRKAGIDPTKNVDADGWRWFELGSATGFAFVDEIGGEVFLQVAAEVMPLPGDRDLVVPLMRELLELNTNIWGSARFGIRNRRVYASVSAAVRDLDADDVSAFINEVMALADTVDDQLVQKYGGSSRQRA